MGKILFVNACVRPDSRTLVLAKHVLGQMEGEIEEVRLEQEPLAPLDRNRLQERERYAASKDFSAPMFRYARQFVEADEIVIAAPYWDLLFPAVVRTYLESVTVCGLSFKYSPQGVPIGLCKAGRLIYVTTAGGPIGGKNLGYDYIKALSHTFYGISDVTCFKAENLDIVGADVDAIMDRAIREIHAAFYN